jgi:hypothetical protein
VANTDAKLFRKWRDPRRFQVRILIIEEETETVLLVVGALAKGAAG